MDVLRYDYTALNPESFQKLAQSLVVERFPDTQCLPVGQPDGGRDAILRMHSQRDAGFVVFQVKFSRDPGSKDERDAVQSAIETEQEKVRDLVAKGATKYYLITNVRGTAHLDRGSIDKVDDELTKALGIPSMVWWQDDLDAQLDNSFDIKWSFPEICRGSDVLGFLMKRQSDEEDDPSSRTLEGYFGTQYADDRDVKFKQVELTRKLTDLYVDLPVETKALGKEGEPDDVGSELSRLLQYSAELSRGEYEGSYHRDEFWHEGRVASFFLQMPVEHKVARFVIEGAPGQGKSTATQYICQVNRMRLLKKPEALTRDEPGIPEPVRAPFRVDLRDFAAWTSGRHPYEKSSDSVAVPEDRRSLESFLAMQVAWGSGGLEITQDQLLRCFAKSHSLIVLDGFDEVADTELRGRLVREICLASERLSIHALSIQIIVTSRPAAFSSSPGFPEEDWIHLRLRDLDREDIEEYKDNWMSVQSLSSAEKTGISETLDAKLELPHLSELARNPMQLAILLHLIHIQGAALPDKRTALYEKYVDLFFNREAEKTVVVRDHRDLLMSIQGYLGWMLQTQAEEGKGSGSVEKKELELLVENYLKMEGFDEAGLSTRLLTGIEERVGALVSRVEGTYEFEVQPLREYFTARYLYQGAPHSAPGKEKTGTRPERFEVLARSPYWTNVARFFCGFYGRGELGTLVDGLEQLNEVHGYELLNQPRELALMLMSDWVFAQSPRDMKKIVELVSGEPGFRRFLVCSANAPGYDLMALPERSGQKELREACLARLDGGASRDEKSILRSIIAQNTDPKSLKEMWLRRCEKKSSASEAMVEALGFQLSNQISPENIETLCEGDRQLQLRWLSNLDHYGEISKSPELFELGLQQFLNGRHFFSSPRKSRHDEETFCLAELSAWLRPYGLAALFSESADVPVERALKRRMYAIYSAQTEATVPSPSKSPLEMRTIQFSERVKGLMEASVPEWQGSLKPWTELVDAGFDEFPDSRIFEQVAHVASAVRSPAETGLWSNDGWKRGKGLTKRFLFARLRSEQLDWWEREIELADGTEYIVACMASCFAWSDWKVLLKLNSRLAKTLNQLTTEQWEGVVVDLRLILRAKGKSDEQALWETVGLTSEVDVGRLAYLLILRSGDSLSARDTARAVFRQDEECDRLMLQKLIDLEFLAGDEAEFDWQRISSLSVLARASDIYVSVGLYQRRDNLVPEEIAVEALTKSDLHSGWFLSLCERSYSIAIAKKSASVAKTALDNCWFEQAR